MRKTAAFAYIIILCCTVLCCALSCSCIGPDKDVSSETDIPAEVTDASTQTPAEPTETITAAPTEAPEDTHCPVTVEWLAAELMYRCYEGWIALEQADFTDIMDRNADTDLFFYANQLEIECVRMGLLDNILGTSSGEAFISSVIDESETDITADIHVFTHVEWADPMQSEGAGTSIRITVDKQRMVIIAFDQPNIHEGIYSVHLKPLAMRFRADGSSWEEADKNAFDELHSRLETNGGF